MKPAVFPWVLWWVIWASAAGLGCGDGSKEIGGEGGPICPGCIPGVNEPPTGAASTVAPTPCQQSERGAPIEATAARSLGFGSGLDLVERAFDSPLQWKALETRNGGPARGYSPTTRVMGRTKIAALEHRIPSLAGCADHLAVTLDVSLSTGDGAIHIDGQIRGAIHRGATAPIAWGSLDLANARGTLQLSPDPWSAPLAGRLGLYVRFWPDRVRGEATIRVIDAGREGGDVVTYLYAPLVGRWEIDDCWAFQRPMTATEPGATPDGRSVDQLRTDLQRLLDAKPMRGRWDGAGAEVAVEARIGDVTTICASSADGELTGAGLSYRTALEVMTSDGRIRVRGDAHASATFDKTNALFTAWVGIFNHDTLAASEFAAKSGIAGVDLGALPAAFWYVGVHLAENGVVAPRGKLGVEGIDLDGKMTGVMGAVTGPITSFEWP